MPPSLIRTTPGRVSQGGSRVSVSTACWRLQDLAGLRLVGHPGGAAAADVPAGAVGDFQVTGPGPSSGSRLLAPTPRPTPANSPPRNDSQRARIHSPSSSSTTGLSHQVRPHSTVRPRRPPRARADLQAATHLAVRRPPGANAATAILIAAVAIVAAYRQLHPQPTSSTARRRPERRTRRDRRRLRPPRQVHR
ncbi:hypothetical protein LV779_35200 [Streptomyces thinghirensis]|nr:hypothetical protein [Streptomyces thinghirensis]